MEDLSNCPTSSNSLHSSFVMLIHPQPLLPVHSLFTLTPLLILLTPFIFSPVNHPVMLILSGPGNDGDMASTYEC
jgi:hypothetical protein